MKSTQFYIFLALLSAFSCISPSKNKTTGSSTLFTVADKEVSNDEFVYVYTKNNFYEDSSRQESVEEYLDLFINFKLKVKEAEALGLDQDPAFQRELAGYKKQLAQPYLTENKVTEDMVREAYDRLKTEVNASHILIAIAPEASPKDTLKAYEKIQQIRKKALSPKYNFEELAKQYSDDPSAKMNGGNLGYFTALQMVYPFEEAAYETPEGQISAPVRTQFGYHIIKVNDKRPSQGKVRVAHIMVRVTQGMEAEDTVKARRKIFEIHRQLDNGVEWERLCQQFSDDYATRNKGGVLPWFGTGDMVPAFEDAAFALDKPGDYSEPVKTPYGWHILKLMDRREMESFEQMKPSLKRSVSQASRAEVNQAALLKRLKAENNFKTNGRVWEKLQEKADSSLTQGRWKVDLQDKTWQKELFEIGDTAYLARSFYDYTVKNAQKRPDLAPAYYLQTLYDEYVEQSIIAYEEAHLEEKYPEYRHLVQEYREGILLFKLMDEKVWSKATRDSTGLARFYQENREQYKKSERAEAYLYSASSKEVQQTLKKRFEQALDTGQLEQIDYKSVKSEFETEFNAKTPLTLQVESTLYQKEELPETISWKPGVYELSKNGRYNLVVISEILSPTYPELQEIKGQVISDYQDYLEKEWIRELKAKYPVTINEKELTKIKKRFEAR